MRIRRGDSSDSKVIAELIASFQTVLTLVPGGAGAEEYLASVSERAERGYLESSRYMYLVLELKSNVVGFIAIRDKTHLFHLFVGAEHQRKGLAQALWREAREQLRQGSESCMFTVNSSVNAVPVYTSFGFIPVGKQVQAHGIAFQPMRLYLQNDGI